MHVVVCGGGVIGAAAAFALTQRGVNVTLVERWRVAGCASGKSGGFLARDWCDGTPLEDLAHRSYDLHAEWADLLKNPYGYRPVDTFGVVLSDRFSGRSAGQETVSWLTSDIAGCQRLGTRQTTAQFDPQAFTSTLVEAAVRRGAKLQVGCVVGLNKVPSTEVESVQLADGARLSCDAAILALGPWSPLAAGWIEMPAVYGLKGHSIVFRPKTSMPPEAVFAEVEMGDGDVVTPEIVPRADGTLYICGMRGHEPIPIDPAAVTTEESASQRLRDVAYRLVPALSDAAIVAEQACFRPITSDGLPVIGRADDCSNVLIATGHSVWGMLNAPGTGEALADLITTGAADKVSLAPFSPTRRGLERSRSIARS